ncbi:MAG: hypothetical protein QXX12_00310 [Nanopusillaceae archaeon]
MSGDCRSWTDEEVIEWLREHYPQFASPEFVEVGRRILRRIFCVEISDGAVPIADFPKFAGRWVQTGDIVIVEQVGARTYEGCAVCGRKNCSKHPDAGTMAYEIRDYAIADSTGETRMSVVGRAGELPDLKAGQVVRAWGRITEWRGRYEMTVYDLDRIRVVRDAPSEPPKKASKQVDERVDKVVRAVKTAQASGAAMSVKQFEALCAKLGVKADEVLKSGLVRTEGQKVVVSD